MELPVLPASMPSSGRRRWRSAEAAKRGCTVLAVAAVVAVQQLCCTQVTTDAFAGGLPTAGHMCFLLRMFSM